MKPLVDHGHAGNRFAPIGEPLIFARQSAKGGASFFHQSIN